MTYFSNSEEVEWFEANVCATCIHYRDEDGCPILNAYAAYQGVKGAQDVLDMLIETKIGPEPSKSCTLYVEKPGGAPWD